MKKVLFSVVCLFVGVFVLNAQPTLKDHVTFENGMPAGWTASNAQNVVIDQDIHSTGEKSLWMKPSSSGAVTFTSPVYNITPGHNVRIEMSHLPIIKNSTVGAYIEVKTSSNSEWQVLNDGGTRISPQDFDRTYGGNEASFDGLFYTYYYWNFFGNVSIPKATMIQYLTDTSNYYYNKFTWKHAVFYLSNILTANDNTFQVRFVIPQTTSANTATGWFLDDIRLFESNISNEDIRVPQITSVISVPKNYNFPNCSDIEISFNLQDRNGSLSNVADSLYVEYYLQGSPTQLYRVPLVNVINTQYIAHIPYAGVDSVICWRAVINDHKNNRLTYPFPYGTYFKTKSVIPYVGDTTITQTGTSNDEMIFKTGSTVTRAKYQTRYKASELLNAGFGPGVLRGLSIKVTQTGATGALLPNFRLRVGTIAPMDTVSSQDPYAGVNEVYNNPNLALPGEGWFYFPFTEDQYITWDGISDLIITSCFDSPNVVSSSVTKVECISTATGAATKRVELGTSGYQEACITQWPPNDSQMTKRPNFKFDFVDICFFEHDAGISRDSIISPANAATCDSVVATTGYCIAGQNYPLTIKLKNDGTSALDTIKVYYMLDNNTSNIQSATWTGHLEPNATTNFTLTNAFSPAAGQHKLTVWSALDYNENIIDWNLRNDTAHFNIIVSEGQMNGVYAIGGTVAGVPANRTYQTFEDAFFMMINSGVNGPVTFKVKGGTLYDNSIVFPDCVPGVSALNTVTFESADTNNRAKFAAIAYDNNNEPTSTLQPTFTLDGVKHFKLKYFDIKPTTASSLIKLSNLSDDIDLVGLRFVDTIVSPIASTTDALAASYINVGAANNVRIDSCVFNFKTAASHPRAIYIKGLSPINPNTGVKILNSTFNVGTRTVIYVEYNSNTTIQGNTFVNGFEESNYTGLSETRYVVTAMNTQRLNFEANRAMLKGLSALSLSSVSNSRVVNNQLSIYNFSEQSVAAYLSYGVNLVSGSNDTIAFNNVYGKSVYSYDRRVVGINLGAEGQETSNNIFKNNMMVSDGHGFALVVKPTDSENSSASFTFSNNMYYKTTSVLGMPLLSYNGATNTTEESWQLYTGETSSSYTRDPVFASWDNLYTTVVYPCGRGVSINNITKDFYGHNRPTNANPCIGAREYEAPRSNIHVLSTGLTSGTFDGNQTYSSCFFENETVFVTFINLSNDTILAGNGKFKYKVDNNNVVSYTYPNQIIPDSIYTVEISTPFNFSTTTADIYFTLKTWSDVTADTINDNDTAWAYVNSFAQLPALSPMSINIDYGATATLNVTSQDSIYWYYHLTDEEPFLKSHTYVTDALLHDTAFYFSRKSEIPVLKITEIQFISATEGLTDPMPSWDLVANNVYEISNLGTGAINMTGYKFAYVRDTKPGTPTSPKTLSASMTKTYTFPNNFILQPNTSVWLINKAGTSTNEVLYMSSGTGVIDTNSAGFLIKDNTDSILDAVTINYANFHNNTSVPSSAWSGYVVTPTTTQQISGTTPTTHIAGIRRTNVNGTNASAWNCASDANPMTIGIYDDNLTVHVANDCYGDKTVFNVIINDPPVNEIALTHIELANGLEAESCGLTDVSFTVKMVNMGAYATTTPIPLVAELYEGGTMISTFADNYTPSLSTDTATYTLNGTFDVSATTQTRDFTVVIYSNLAIDTINYNDTVSMTLTSLQTPLPPVTQNVNIPYASSTTLTANGGSNRLVWYSDLTSSTPLATGDYTTPILYETTTYYVESLQREDAVVEVGTGTSTTGTSGNAMYPGPLNAKQQHLKEQYLYKASDLINAGLQAGNINSIAFHVATVTLGSGQTAANLQDLNIKIGTTTGSVLSAWQTGLTDVYSGSLSLTAADNGSWVTMNFDNPYEWDGESNIVVQICFASSTSANTVKTYHSTTSYNATIAYKHASNDACTFTGTATATVQRLPNVRFGIDDYGCNSARTPLTVNVDDAPNCEPSLSRFVSPEGSTVESGLSTPISVVLHNNGGASLTSATIKLYIGNVATPTVSYPWTGDLASGDSVTVLIDNHTFTPGALTLTAVVVKDCDNIHSNDTIRLPINICVGNSTSVTTYTIAPNSTTADYPSISAAVQDLAVSGVCGPIVFNINNATYTERFTLPYINGVSEENTITFQAANPSAMPKINANTTDGILLDSTEYVIFKDLEFATSGNITLMDINNSRNISFEGVKFTTTAATATLVNLRGANQNIEFLNDSLYGGKIQMKSDLLTSTTNVSSGLLVSSCWFWGASSNSIAIASFDDVQIVKNIIRQQASTETGKAISFRKVSGDSRIEGNSIYMVNGTKVRQGIEVKASNFTALSPLMVFNNSVSIKGTTSSSINSLGIDVDTSSYVNLYFNTVNMASSTNSASSISLKVGKGSSNVIVRNNNLDNSAKGYAYYVETATVVSLSNNNNYAINGTKFAYWAGNIANLTALRTANNMDASSFSVENPFTNDSILAILYPTDIANAGVSIEGISKDILNRNRPIAPGPTIGAYELMRNDYDAGVTQINQPLATVDYIEGDQIPVSVRIKNFGNYSITSLDIVAKLKRHQDDATPVATLQETFTGMLTSMDETDFNFTGTFTAELNDPINDSYYLEVYTIIEDDEDPLNDTSNVAVKVIPAYNLQMVKTENITERCKLFNQSITVQFKNVGVKAIHSTDTVYLTYEVENRPDMTVTEQLHLPYTYNGVTYDSIQHNVQIGYTFTQTTDFYPLGTSDTTWKVRSYITFAKDHILTNDTSNYMTINSRVSPPAPVALNDTVFYGTIGHPSATQTGHLAIKWFTDSLQAEPFYTASYSNSLGGYNPYTTANRVFADSVYYTRVNLTGTYPCESFFTEVKVVVRDRQPVDMAALDVTAPLHTTITYFTWASGGQVSHTNYETNSSNASVYMEEDTVKFRIINYGTQPASGFNVSYSIATSATAEPTIVTETCDATILPDQQYTYSFINLADVSDPSKTYRIRAWVDAIDDVTSLNDTSEYRLVKPLNGNTVYPTPTVTTASSLDITRVQFVNIDNSTIAGDDTYSNFTQTVEPAILFKGITDTLYVQHQNASSMEAGLFHSGWMKVYVDWNMNGVFEGEDTTQFYNAHYPNWELVYSDTVLRSETTNIIPITVPTQMQNGKTRMRIILSQEDSKHNFQASETNMTIAKGEIEDYLLQILPMEENNAQLLRFTSPSETFQTAEQQTIKVMLKNVGRNSMTSANIHWFVNDEEQNVVNWSGNLSTSHTQEVTLGTINVGHGETSLRAYVELPGDTYNTDDTVLANIFRFKTYDITYEESFDNQLILNNDFYPYEANAAKPENCWQLGIPDADSNSKITEAYSYPYCWKTNLTGKYPKNNMSILYSPVFNIELIKPDTLSFMLYRAMGSATMTVEYLDYQGQWQIIEGDTIEGVPSGHNWYSGQNGFTGTSSVGWTNVTYSLDHLLTNMGITAQFRFIFTSGSGTTSDGVAIDDFKLIKGLRDQDAGVTYVELAPSILPNYGQLFYPKVTVHNYGRGDLSNYRVCYMSEDMHIPTCEDVSYGDNGIAPGEDTIYTFQTGHYLDVAMPDPFSIVAFTRLNPVDLYSENDTARANIVIGPLQKDAAIIAIEQPTEQIVSNDDVEIAIRVRNYGLEPISQLPVSYSITGSSQVDEVISFNPPLYNGDEYIYRFNQRYHASYGSVNLKVWASLPGDYYHDNDTLYKRLQGSSYTQDIEARYITIDDRDPNSIGVQLAFLNRSSIGIGDITVGYYYDGDINNKVEETYRLGSILPAGDYGYHYFTQKLPRRVYQSICAYVVVPNEVNLSNDTTCTLMIGYTDGFADTIFIEETVAEDCLVQLVGHNNGTLGGNTMVTAHYVINGDWANIVTQTFNWEFDEPNPNMRQYMTFSNRIPKSTNGQYDIVAWLDYPNDWHHWNDTTRIYQVKSFVGLEEVVANESGFVLEQNAPNPYDRQTEITFSIPQSDNVKFYITNTIGQVVYSQSDYYQSGKHTIHFDSKDLPEGIYYYTMEYRREKQVRKMIIVR